MNKKKSRCFFVPFFCAVLAVTGCSFDYGGETAGLDEVPAIVILNSRFVRIDEGHKAVVLSAQSIEMYPKSKSWYIGDLSFEEYKDDGTQEAGGAASLLHVNFDTEEFVFAGGVSLELIDEELSIESDNLYWNEEQRLLSGDVSGRVTIRKPDNTELTGIGFQADGLSREFFFARNISGTIMEGAEQE